MAYSPYMQQSRRGAGRGAARGNPPPRVSPNVPIGRTTPMPAPPIPATTGPMFPGFDQAGAAERAAAQRAAAADAADLDRLGPRFNVPPAQWDIADYAVDEAYGYQAPAYGEQEMYNPYSVSAMNFDPYRRQGLADVSGAAASGLASAQDRLAATGGASAADRMALASQANRDRIQGRQGVLGRVDAQEAANRYQTQAANVGAMNRAQQFNIGEGHRRQKDLFGAGLASARDLAAEKNLRKRQTVDAVNRDERAMAAARYRAGTDKFEADRQRHLLGKQLEYGDLASEQAAREAGRPPSFLEDPTRGYRKFYGDVEREYKNLYSGGLGI